jgi:methionyl-tRNA formyltransferase
VRLVFAGTPEAAVPSLRALLRSDHEVVAVVTRPDAPAGRGRTLTASPIATLAVGAGIEVLTPRSPREPEFRSALVELAPHCCPVVAYGGLIPSRVLAVPAHGWVNLHFSVLPAWRGAAPVQRAIIAGDPLTGATTFRLVDELDAGPVYGVVTEEIRADDTAGSLLERLAEHGAELLVRTLDGIEGGALHAVPQPPDGVSLAPKLSVADARVRWTEPALAVDRRVRGCTPAPGAWTTHAGDRLKLGPVTVPDDPEARLPPGAVAVGRHDVHVGTATAPVRLGEVQAAGKPWMRAADWARGLRAPLARLGDE